MSDLSLAFFGGIYSNWRALAAATADVRRRGSDGLYALGDFGAFGPNPDRVFPLLLEAGAQPIQGNYEESLSTDASDCHCGYTDPRDNFFAQISYDYTAAKTSSEWKGWIRTILAVVIRPPSSSRSIAAFSSGLVSRCASGRPTNCFGA